MNESRQAAVVIGDQRRDAIGKISPEEIEWDDLAGSIRWVVFALPPLIGSLFVTGEVKEPSIVNLVVPKGTGIEPLTPEQRHEREGGQAGLPPCFAKHGILR